MLPLTLVYIQNLIAKSGFRTLLTKKAYVYMHATLSNNWSCRINAL